MIKHLKKVFHQYANHLLNDEFESHFENKESVFKDIYSLGQYLPYESFDENSEIYYNRESKGIVIEADPISGATDDIQDHFYSLLQRLLPEGSIVQFLIYASPYIGSELDAYEAERKDGHPILEKLAKQRADYWKKGVYNPLIKNQPVTLRDFKCLVVLTFDNALELGENQIISLKNSLIAVLRGAGMRPRLLEPPQLIQWVRSLLIVDGSLYQKDFDWDELNPIRSRMMGSGYAHWVMPSKIAIHEGESTTWQIRNFHIPQFNKYSPHLSEMSDLVGGMFDSYAQMGCPFSLSFVIQIANQTKEYRTVQLKCARAIQRAHMIGKISPKAIDEAHDARNCVKKLEEFERLVIVSFQASIYCKHVEAETHHSNLFNLFQSSSRRWSLEHNKLIQLPMLTFHLPMNQTISAMEDLSKLQKTYKLWAKNAAGMLPIVAETKGMDSRKLMIVGRRGQVFFFDPFSNQRGNYNTCVAGIAGSGKSVVVQDLASSLLGTGGRVFIIDIGRSYKKLCNLLNGQFIEFRSDSKLCLNPFSSVNCEEIAEFYDFMVNFIAMMINPNQGLSLFERAYVEKAIKNAWDKKGNNASISDIADFLLASEDERANDLGVALYPYTRQGQYGHFFNGKATVSFNNPLVVFELEEISGNKLLQSIIFTLLMHHVTEKMYLGDRKTKITLIVDEAWTMLKGGQGGSIIESIARKARKYKGSLITITQSVMDYFLSEAAQAAFANSYWKIVLMQNKGDIESLVEQRKLPLNPFQKRLLCSVKTEHGAYSEMVILGDAGEFVCGRLLLDPYSRVLYSTQADDFAAVNELCKEGIELKEAIEIVAKRNFPNEY